jgi:hypothetical protein
MRLSIHSIIDDFAFRLPHLISVSLPACSQGPNVRYLICSCTTPANSPTFRRTYVIIAASYIVLADRYSCYLPVHR